jgi:NitT/TauT family transport system substrate-binding protein
MQDRRHFLKTGFSMAAAGLAGAAALTGVRRSLAAEPPPETTSVRLPKGPPGGICLAPLYIVDDLLREEGFVDVRYVLNPRSREDIDFYTDYAGPAVMAIEAGAPIIVLAGVHPGCFELFARETIRSASDLKGAKVGVRWVGASEHVLLSIIAASIGLDPAKDVIWVFNEGHDQKELFAAGAIDAFMTFAPFSQELRARNFGHVILNSSFDRPRSEYYCCMLSGNTDFVRRNPIATKRVVRAMARATDICAAKPDWVAQSLVDRGFTPRYDYARQGLDDVSYRAWRDYDPEDSVRFFALRLREIGMIKSSPDKIIATGTDWRFIREVRKEFGI